MYDLLCRKFARRSDSALPNLEPSMLLDPLPGLCLYLRASSATDCARYATSVPQVLVCRINNRVCLLERNVSFFRAQFSQDLIHLFTYTVTSI